MVPHAPPGLCFLDGYGVFFDADYESGCSQKLILGESDQKRPKRGLISQNAVLRIIYRMFVDFDWKSCKNVNSMISDYSDPLIRPNGAVCNFWPFAALQLYSSDCTCYLNYIHQLLVKYKSSSNF